MKIAFLGGGNMGCALIGGLLQRGFVAADMHVVELLPQARERLQGTFGVACHDAVDDAVLACDVLVLAVKPQQMRAACAPLAGRLRSQLVVSIAAGIRLPDLARWLGGHRLLVRAMPNTPALIGAGVTGLYADAAVSAQQRSQAQSVLAAVGTTLWVDDEGQMDAVTAISGSGPAYFFHFIEALQQAARELGFSDEQARTLSLGTALGAAQLAAGSDEDVAVLRRRVTSKGGTTEAALASLAADGVAAAIGRAVRAAEQRGRELGEIMGKDTGKD
ncbi:MAG: pyrroline-5-carboxylate reductase [Betaproteobacteria bacterium]|nr:pyrroline-5-carboxylate reductase [Betaproteobacteria bacterium]